MKIFITILTVLASLSFSNAQANKEEILFNYTLVGTNGGEFVTNFANPPVYALAGSEAQTSFAAFTELLSSSSTTTSNIAFAGDFSIHKTKWDTNTTVWFTNSLTGTNWAYRLNSVASPAHARWYRVKTIRIPAGATTNTISLTLDRN